MFCSKCGNELPEGEAFCGKCGARTGNAPSGMENASAGPDKKPGKKGIIIGITAACLIIAVAVVVLAVFVFGGQGKSDDDGRNNRHTDESASKEDGGEDQDKGEAQDGQGLTDTPLYSTVELETIDLSAQIVVPGTKIEGMDWDRSLFYWLEDADTTVETDGNIAYCRLSKTMLRNAQSGKVVQYEIYSDPDSGSIYKIVSIEEEDGVYRLTDYYYKDGKPNFIFERFDSVYTPTYATTDKTGERFYIDSDVLVRWRKIQVPGQIEEYTLNPNNPWYTQKSYFAESEEFRSLFDMEEAEKLNAAYITYEAVVNGRNVGLVEGVLSDTLGNPQAGTVVNIRRSSDNVLLYQTTTDDRGAFSMYVYLEDVECYISVVESGEFRELTVYGINLRDSALTYSYALVLHKINGDEYPVTLCAYPAMDIRTDGSGAAAPVGAITAAVREGAQAYRGTILSTVQADENGMVTLNLVAGTYTIQISAEGYMDTYLEVEVADAAVSRAAYVLPEIAGNQTAVVMTWDNSDIDLDLTLFTPHQSTGGDMAHVGGKTLEDGFGNQLIADNENTCEVMFINSGETGSHKLYVNNYTHSTAGNYTSDLLLQINVHIYIYDSKGFVADYTVPLGQIGVVWEVAEINGSRIMPGQRVYSRMEGKSWWLESKEVWMAEEDVRLLALLNSGDSRLGSLLDALLTLGEGGGHDINAVLQGTPEGIETLFGLKNGVPVFCTGGFDSALGMEGLGLEHFDGDGWYRRMTKEDAEKFFYSVCGKKVELDFSGYAGWNDPYLQFGCADGAPWWRAENFTVERVNANTWKVRANSTGYSNGYDGGIASGRVCFTVVRNSDSYFEGYSLTGFAVEEEADASWVRAYYDYLTKDPDGIAMMEYGFGSGWQEYDYQYALIYVDDDLVPELYLQGRDLVSGDALLHFHDGKVTEVQHFSDFGGSYIPYTGLMCNDNTRWGVLGEDIYKLENGEMTMIGGWYGHWSDRDIDPKTGYPIETDPNEPIVEIKDGFKLNGVEVTQEQYEETINSYLGGAEFQSCVLYGQNQDVISYLEFLMSYADMYF